MTSFVADLLRKFFPSQDARLLCVGLDASGRTSWLYFKKLGHVVTTIPTIGFNVEMIEHAGYSMSIWDVGGCDKIRPLWRHYFQNTDGLLMFVDANDRDRMDETRRELETLMAEPELQDAFCLVIANKQDLPRALTPAEVSERLQLPRILAVRRRLWACLPGALGAERETDAQFDWIVSALRQSRLERARHSQQHQATMMKDAAGPGGASTLAAAAAGGAASNAGTAQSPPSSSDTAAAASDVDALARLAAAGGGGAQDGGDGGGGGGDVSGGGDVLERWLFAEDEPDEEFLRKLEDYTLDSWDHRTHLRLAWLYLTRHGRREGLRRIHTAIHDFITHSPRTARRSGTTYHETMTYFWAHMVHFAIASQKLPEGASPDFKLFLLLNPQLTNGGLFLHYYSKQLMLHSPESRVRVVLPDKRPLPSIITDLTALRQQLAPQPPATAAAPQHLSDAEFLDHFLGRSLDRWNHECLLRALYCCLSRHGRRCGGELALGKLRSLQGDHFHLTIAYFWLSALTHTLVSEHHAALFPERPLSAAPAALEMLPEATPGAGGAVVITAGGGIGGGGLVPLPPQLPEWRDVLSGGGYTSVRLRELVADERRYLRHYSEKVLFSEAAAREFVPPDKRPLPSTA